MKRGQASKYNNFSMKNDWTKAPQIKKKKKIKREIIEG